ncbi:hypothetical protein DRF58_01350 [Epilithonimonas hispanica]|uniref:Uncharacterized protein n=1 Tax=Epilithonimonas hispanica TaxID=358687 RepID=A0A3D9D4U9_9FLAO|nr:hypothetical protein DRF58_01350 [Epilithonimonas hispanica]
MNTKLCNYYGSLIHLPLPIFFADDFSKNKTRVQAKKDFRSSRAAVSAKKNKGYSKNEICHSVGISTTKFRFLQNDKVYNKFFFKRSAFVNLKHLVIKKFQYALYSKIIQLHSKLLK